MYIYQYNTYIDKYKYINDYICLLDVLCELTST